MSYNCTKREIQKRKKKKGKKKRFVYLSIYRREPNKRTTCLYVIDETQTVRFFGKNKELSQ